jgi:hypothetical protein
MTSRFEEEEFDDKVEEGFALASAPLIRSIMDTVKPMLPSGTHFGVLILVPSVEKGKAGRVLAATTDRDIVAPAAAQWVLTVLPKRKG